MSFAKSHHWQISPESVYPIQFFKALNTKSLPKEMSAKSSPKASRFQAPQATATQVSFGLHSIQGSHLKEQAAVVCVNGSTFVLYPRFMKKDLRLYESAYTMFIPPNEDVSFSVGVITPEGKSKGFLHCFMKHTVRAPKEPLLQELTLKSPGDVYTVEVSLYVCPSTRTSMSESGTVRAADDARAKTTVAQRYKGESFKRPASRQALSRTEGSIK